MNKLIIQNSVKKIKNKFDLILEAAKRARKIQKSHKEMIISNDQSQNKCTVIALKELQENYKIE